MKARLMDKEFPAFHPNNLEHCRAHGSFQTEEAFIILKITNVEKCDKCVCHITRNLKSGGLCKKGKKVKVSPQVLQR